MHIHICLQQSINLYIHTLLSIYQIWQWQQILWRRRYKIFIYVYIYVCTYTYIRMHIHIYIIVCILTYICIYRYGGCNRPYGESGAEWAAVSLKNKCKQCVRVHGSYCGYVYIYVYLCIRIYR